MNSVYRFFAWGMMPIGAALGGAVVSVVDGFASHTVALRSVWFAEAIVMGLLFVFGAPALTTSRIDDARTAGA